MLAKYDTLTNYIKEIYLHIASVIRDGRSNNRDALKRVISGFDKTIEDYNQHVVYKRNHVLDFMWIEGTTLYRERVE